MFQFDISGIVPSKVKIENVVFEFEDSQHRGAFGQTVAEFSLHRVTTSWDEGSGMLNIGQQTGEGVTWVMATASTAWKVPGGDFDNDSSGATIVDGTNHNGNPVEPIIYRISSPQLVQDVQNIVDGFAEDFGLLLKNFQRAP